MLVGSICVCCLLLWARHSVCQPVQDPTTPWLPKCCPSGKQLAGDGKSCVKDGSDTVEYNVGDDANTTSPSADLSVSMDNKTVTYRLEHRTKFSCARHEVYVVHDDIVVTPDDRVLVYDDFGDNWSLSRAEVCVDSVHIPPGMGLPETRVFVALLCPSCDQVVCLHKCCPEGQQLQIHEDGTNAECAPSSGPAWSQQLLPNSSERPFVFHGFPECSNSLYLDYPGRPMEVSTQGHLRFETVTVPRTEYCGDMSSRGYALLACRHMSTRLKHTLYGGLFCLGAVFLALTLVLHLWLPDLRKTLHSRILIAHVACLLASYVVLAAVNLSPLHGPSPLCSSAAFFIQFTVLAAIFWLNVMCVDIAWTFSGLRAPKASLNLDSDSRKFLYYSLYAWGATAIISGATAFLEYSPLIPANSRFKPSFGSVACWFEHWESILLLVYGPMGFLLVANMVLFVYTAYKIQRTRRDTANMVQHAGSKLRENKDRFSLYLKLFGLMGITWVFEIVSWMVGGADTYWYLTDIINALRGVFIFVLFCVKKKVLLLIKAKLFPKKRPKFPKHPRKSTSSKFSSSLTSQRTNSIQMSQVS